MKILPGFWRRSFLVSELALAIVVAFLLVLWAEWFGGREVLDGWIANARAPLYGALAGIFASLLGFAIATVAIVLGHADSPRLRLVRESAQYPTLWKVFKSAMRWLAVATIVTLAALILDPHAAGARWIGYTVLAISLVVLLRLARCIWVLEKIIDLVGSHR